MDNKGIIVLGLRLIVSGGIVALVAPLFVIITSKTFADYLGVVGLTTMYAGILCFVLWAGCPEWFPSATKRLDKGEVQ